VSLVARLFDDSFLATSWPDRVCHVAGDSTRFADAGSAWLAQLVDELALRFAAHACEHYIAPIPRPGHREVIVVHVGGSVEYALPDRRVVLEPGGALFLPRELAYTAVDADARAHVFSFGIPSWLEMLSATALNELSKDLAWRARVAPDDATFRALVAPFVEQLRALRPPRR
jgi:hypothetical protein